MKKFLIALTIIVLTFSSCDNGEPYYPTYQIVQSNDVPDSLKTKHGNYILKMVNAGYENGSGSENIDDILKTSKNIADRMYTTKIMGLRKDFNENDDDDLFILPKDFTPMEIRIYEYLLEDSNRVLPLSTFKRKRNVENEQAK